MRITGLCRVESIVAVLLLAVGCAAGPEEDTAHADEIPGGGIIASASALVGTPLRYLAINVGNASVTYGCWEYKLCRSSDVADLRSYIAAWKPDVIMLSEVYRSSQLTGTDMGGPILPAGYTGRCGESRDRNTGALVAWNASSASHEHECIAWKTSRLSYVAGSALSAYGRNDTWGKSNCNYDFTGFRVTLLLDGSTTITAAAVHPDSGDASCRTEEVARYWSQLATGAQAVIGGDFNTGNATELQVPSAFRVNYSGGRHWSLATHDEYTAFYVLGVQYRYDHAYSNFGSACTGCGSAYSTVNLDYGSVVGGYHSHPRADAGDGMDHRQLLVDLTL